MFDSKRWLSCLKTEWIQQRYVLTLMGLLGLVNAFAMRVALAVAITEMTKGPTGGEKSSDSSCAVEDSVGSDTTQTSKESEFNWSEADQGMILSAFYIGYILTHIPGGVLADRFGGKHTLGWGILATAICTLITPWAARVGDVWAVWTVRVIMGLGEGVTFPALNVLLAHWVPPLERSRLGGMAFAGSQLGTLIGSSMSGVLLQAYNWDVTFYVFGILGLLWCVFWCILCYSEPADHPFISDKELKYLYEHVVGAEKFEQQEHVETPWKAILTSVPVWGLVLTELGHDWGFYTMATDLPKYMSQVLHFNISQSGFLSALPFLVMWISSFLTGLLADALLTKRLATTTTVRKVFTTVASVGPGVFLLAASYAGCDRVLVVTLFCLGMGCMGAFYPGMRVNALDLSPRHAGTISAIVNGSGSLAGIAAPQAVGQIASHGLISKWRIVFWITLVMLAGTNMAFVLMGSGEVQWWDQHSSVKRENSEKPPPPPEISTVL